jgi:2-oxoglutarate ferredoxin oxidoreductase subunit alpha
LRTDTYTVLIGGKAGEGVKKLGQVIAAVGLKLGLHSFQMDDYQSLIKGGHNFSLVSFSPNEINNAYHKADLIICLDELTIHNTSMIWPIMVSYTTIPVSSLMSKV